MLYTFKENGLYGFIDENGKVIVPPKYSFAENFSEGFAGAFKEDDRYVYVNAEGREVIQRDSCGKKFHDGYALAWFDDEGFWGFIDEKGNTVIEPQFDEEYTAGFREGLVDVCKNEKWGYIDKKGQVVIPFEYDWTYPFSEGFAIVKQKRKKFFIDRNGEKLKTVKCIIVEPAAGGFREGLAVVKFGKEYGFINTNGEQAFEQLFESASGFRDGLSAVRKDGKFGFIDTKGEYVIAPQFEVADSFYRGISTFKKGDQWGLIDKNGSVIKEAIYDFIHGFGMYADSLSEKDERRLALASFQGRDVYINFQGEIVAERELNPKSKFDHDLLKNWKSKEVWDKAEWYLDGGTTTVKGATQHIYFVLKWLKSKELLTQEGMEVLAGKNDPDVALYRDLLTPEGANFLDRYYKLWYENEGIINFQIDPSVRFEKDEKLGEYWDHFQENK